MWLLALLIGCGPEERPDYVGPGVLQFAGPAPQNLLFLSIDTLRRDRLDVYGAAGISPFLAQLASESLVLDDHQQCSAWTAPGMACTLAGRTNLELGFAPRLGSGQGEGMTLPEDQTLLAGFLEREGFWTGLVSGNFWLSPDLGTGRDYRAYAQVSGEADGVRAKGLELMGDRPDDGARWFLHLHHMEPHFPYTPPEEALVGYDALEPWPEDLTQRYTQIAWRDAYDTLSDDDQALLAAHFTLLYEAEVRALDSRLEQTWAELEAGGWLDDTLVVIWSDHGEQLFERGWGGHAHSLNSEENDAVAMFWAKNLVPGRYEPPTTATDLVPTVLTALELPIPAEVTGAVVGTAPDDRARFSEVLGYGGTAQAVTVQGVKLQYRWDGSLSLYERGPDRAERTDRYSVSDPRVADLWEQLQPQVVALAELLGEEPPAAAGVE